MRGFLLQLKMDLLKYWSWWLYIFSRRELLALKSGRRFPGKISVDFISCFVEIFAKREGKVQSNFDKQKLFHFAPYSALSCSSCIANCIRRRFLITQFLATESLSKNTLADRRQSARSFPLFVRQLSQMCQHGILRLTDLTSYLCTEFYGHD